MSDINPLYLMAGLSLLGLAGIAVKKKAFTRTDSKK